MEYLGSLATPACVDLDFRGSNGTEQSQGGSTLAEVSACLDLVFCCGNQDADSEATKDSQYLIFRQR